MSIVARCGSVALLLSFFVGTAAFAQSAAEPSGSWTDPPARSAAGARTPAAKPSEAKPGAEKSGELKSSGATAQAPAATPAKSAETATAPTARVAAPAVAKPAMAFRRPARVQRALALRRYPMPVRRLAARPRVIAAAPAVRPASGRLRVAARQEQEARRHARKSATIVARRDEPERVARPQRPRAMRYARRYDRDGGYAPPYDGPAEPPMYARRAGWGGLLGDEQAYRIAQARAAGYRVMRMRTYEYPDGSRVQRLMPLDADDLD